MPIAELLRHYRTRALLSQEELAAQSGLSVQAISNLERGVNRTPRSATIRMLAAALNLSEPDQEAFAAAVFEKRSTAQDGPIYAHNLPRQLTPLIGREREVAILRQRLQLPEVRLLTLRGPGGAGKTRLAVQVAEGLAAEFADGVAFVGLASIFDADLVLPTIAQTLDVREATGRSLLESVEDYLESKDLLLVLDNFEQVVLAGSQVARLLSACPQLKAMVTSRVALRVSGEHDYAVPPLSVPAAPDDAPEQISRYEAVQLFVVRTQAVKPDFVLHPDNAREVAEICRRLDGIPLAIELAATRSRLLSPQAILSRLDNRLGLLTSGVLDAPARQRTLRATLDWSYSLLDEPAQRLLSRLSIFPAGCALETVEAVCGSSSGGPAVIESLSSLVDASLLRQVEMPDGEVRFHMLESIREYALARLAESGKERETRQRQTQHSLELAELAGRKLNGPQQQFWLERLETEHDNLRAAIGWSLGAGDDARPGVSLVAALWPFWEVRGYLSEGRRWLGRALQLASQSDLAAVAPYPWAEALRGAGVLSQRQGDYPAARGYLDRSLASYRRLGDEHGLAMTLNALGRVALDEGDYATAQELHEQSLALYRKAADPHGIADALCSLGEVAYCLADFEGALTLLGESLSIRRETGNTRGIATAVQHVSYVMRHQGNLTGARETAEESLALQRSLGDQWGIANSLNILGNVARDQEDYTAAVHLLQECLDLQRRVGDRQGVAYTLHQLSIAARSGGDLATARRLSEESLTMFRELGHRRGVAYVLTALGVTAREHENSAEAREHLEESLRLQHDLGDIRGIASALEELAALAADHEQPDRAARLLGASSALREAIGEASAPAIRRQYDAREPAIAEKLGPDLYAAHWAEGRDMSLDDAVRLALDSV